ncbi:hypothetical protein L2V89_25790 [Escherichia coli]|nr:hypothetical protein [Escherichia coli]
MTSLKTSIKTITYLSDTGCLEIQGASLVKQLTWQLRKAKPDCKLPDKAMDYLKRNGLISEEDILR